MTQSLPDEQRLSVLVSRYRRVALFLYAVAVFQAVVCGLIAFKLSRLAVAEGSNFGALLGEWLAPVDVHRQYSGASVLAFDWIAKLVREAVTGGFLALFGWLMWKRAGFYAALRDALAEAIAETTDQETSSA